MTFYTLFPFLAVAFAIGGGLLLRHEARTLDRKVAEDAARRGGSGRRD